MRPILKPNDLLGKAETDSVSLFAIQFDTSKFDDFWEVLMELPTYSF
jgi:hypothetical protein